MGAVDRMRRRAIAAAVVITSVGATTARGALMESYKRPNVGFTAALKATGKVLDVEYVVSNQTDRTVYVFDRTARFANGKVVVEPDRMFVALNGTDEVRILHAFMGPPRSRDVNRRPPVLATPVAPRAELRRKLALSLPLHENVQFDSADDAPDATPVVVKRVRLIVGWVEQRPGMTVAPQPTAAGEEIKLSGGWGQPVQWLSEMAADRAVPVAPHREPFERELVLG